MYMAMDPATRGWMSPGDYANRYRSAGRCWSTISRVVGRNADPAGTIVAGVGEWAKYMIARPSQITSVRASAHGVLAWTLHRAQLPMCLHAMGTSGGTPYYGP
jgi:NADPH-dependent curcumin reductase CurA